MQYPRHPERTLLYRTVAEHYETWLDLASAGQVDGQREWGRTITMDAEVQQRMDGIFAGLGL